MRHAKRLLCIFLGLFSIFTGIAHASVTYKDVKEGRSEYCDINQKIDLNENQAAGIFWILQDKNRRAYYGSDLLHISANTDYFDHTLRNTIVTYEQNVPKSNWSGNFKGYVTASFLYSVPTTCSNYKQVTAEAANLTFASRGRKLIQKGAIPGWASAGVGVATALTAGILLEAALPATASVATVLAVKCFAGASGGLLSSILSGLSLPDTVGAVTVGCISSSAVAESKTAAIAAIKKALPNINRSFWSSLGEVSHVPFGSDFLAGWGPAIARYGV